MRWLCANTKRYLSQTPLSEVSMIHLRLSDASDRSIMGKHQFGVAITNCIWTPERNHDGPAIHHTVYQEHQQNVFSTMLNMPVTINRTVDQTGQLRRHVRCVSGIIGMSGDVIGSVVLSFPTETAIETHDRFLRHGVPGADSPDFADAVGELVNMVSGSAKGMFIDKDVSISCPSVVIGPGHKINTRSDTPCISIPCSTQCGDLTIEIAIREAEAANQKAA